MSTINDLANLIAKHKKQLSKEQLDIFNSMLDFTDNAITYNPEELLTMSTETLHDVYQQFKDNDLQHVQNGDVSNSALTMSYNALIEKERISNLEFANIVKQNISNLLTFTPKHIEDAINNMNIHVAHNTIWLDFFNTIKIELLISKTHNIESYDIVNAHKTDLLKQNKHILYLYAILDELIANKDFANTLKMWHANAIKINTELQTYKMLIVNTLNDLHTSHALWCNFTKQINDTHFYLHINVAHLDKLFEYANDAKLQTIILDKIHLPSINAYLHFCAQIIIDFRYLL